MKVAIAGAGAISEFHLKGWQAQEDVTLVAICDPDRGRAERRAREFGIPAVYDEVETMLREARPDALDIITPVATHALLVRLASDAGVHVMCQKPMTPTVAEAETLIADVGERVRFMVHENYRYRPHYAELARRVKENQVGQVIAARLTVRSSSLFDYPGSVPFLLGRQPYLADFKRLLVFEILIHHLDALRSIVGEMEVVSSLLFKINPGLKGEDAAHIALRTPTGASVVIDANVSALGYPPLPTDRLEILGDADTLLLDIDKVSLLSRPEVVSVHDLRANYQACFTGAVCEFVSGLRTGRPFATDRLDNLQTLRLMEAVYDAAGKA